MVTAALVALWISTCSTTASAAVLSVRVPTANFRAGPSKEHDILFTGARYFPVRVVERKGSWTKIIDFEGDEAWVAHRLLSPAPAAIVKVKNANVREGPGLRHEKVDKIEYGEAFRIAERKGRWLRLASQGKPIGWVRDDLTWGDERKKRRGAQRVAPGSTLLASRGGFFSRVMEHNLPRLVRHERTHSGSEARAHCRRRRRDAGPARGQLRRPRRHRGERGRR